MNNYCMVETASPSVFEIETIGKVLLDRKLVASCHVIESNSSWNFRGVRESDPEYLLQMKTLKDNLHDIYDVIKKYHSYDVFEFAIYDISGSSEYLEWISKEVEVKR